MPRGMDESGEEEDEDEDEEGGEEEEEEEESEVVITVFIVLLPIDEVKEGDEGVREKKGVGIGIEEIEKE
jgi:hypothetical protein